MHDHVYCTLFDSGYLSRALTLFSSLRDNGDNSPIYVLALDDEVLQFINTQNLFPNITSFTLETIEKQYPELLGIKSSRSRMEYVFTCTPYLIEFASLLSNIPNNLCIYVDSDLYYFGAPETLIFELNGFSVGLTPHRYPKKLESKLSKYGTYNAGWVAFRNDSMGKEALDWYKARTLEWCSDKPSGGKYADQGYLDQISTMQGVKVITDPGANLAPWNTSNFNISLSAKELVLVDDKPLTFFHFHGLRKIRNHYATSQLIYGSPLRKELRRSVYEPYVLRLTGFENFLAQNFIGPRTIRKRGKGLHGSLSRFWKRSTDVISVLTGNAISVKYKVEKQTM